MSNILHKSSIHAVYDDVLLEPEHAIQKLKNEVEDIGIRPAVSSRYPTSPFREVLNTVGVVRLLIAEQCIIYIDHERN